MTEENSDIPKELVDSIRDAIGRKIKLAVKKKVKLEIKSDKVENKVLVLSSCRAFLLTTRIPTKLEFTFSYLEIQGVSCCKPGQLILETERYNFSMKMASSEDVNDVIAHMGTCLRKIFPGLSPVKIMRKVLMEPSERLTNLQTLWESQTLSEPGPCGGFSQTYACVCDWLGLPYREEVQWDVDTIYLTQDTKELNVQDFSHLDHRDLIPIVAALEYNQWFTKLSSKDLKLSADVCDQILRVMSRNNRLEELVLENAGLRIDFAQKLANALAHNPSSGLHTINLANNPLEDRGVSSLSAQFAKLPKGLKHLNMSKASLSPKGVNSLAQSLSANQLIPNTLTHLDLSGNILRGDDLSNLYNFLAQPNALVFLDLSNSDCAVDMVCGALLRGCLQHLSTLHLSRCIFSHRKGKEVAPSFKQFFSSSLALVHINLSGTKLLSEPLKALLLGLACNHNLKEVSLDLSSCELRSGGAQVLEGCIAEIHNISSLDISDNGLESDLSTLVVWLSKNRSIRHLALGKNFNNIKSKNLVPVLDNLVHMIQDEDSPLQSLSLADSKLKADVTIIINALGSNTSLTKVDISGNGMGDMGAKMLAKALQINTKLRTVIWDKNNITAMGFQDIAVALEKNYTLRFMPTPIYDASQALKANPEKTEEALQKIENYLLRNHETRKYLQEQAYRLQQGIVTSTTQQMIDRMCVKLQDHLNSLRYSDIEAVQEDLKLAENFMKDAKNSKTLLPNLYHLGGVSWVGVNSSLSSPIQDALESMAGEVTRVVDEQLKMLLESMVDAAEGLCPHVMKKASIRQDLIETSTEKMFIPRTFVKNVLLEQSGIDIFNKVSEVKLTVASLLSDRVVDEILEALSASHHKLAGHLTRRGKALSRQESLEIEVMDDKPTKRPTITAEDLSELERLEELDTCMMTPKSKRKSIHSRMLRPVSRAFEMEFDLDKALEEIPIHIEDPPPPSNKQERRPPSVMQDLPSEETRKLEHFTKLRPKRNKKQQSSKTTQVSAVAPAEGEQNGLMGRVDEGVDEFFTKKLTRLDSKRVSLKSSDSQDSNDGDEKKKRDSRKSGFLNLIKSRSSKSDRPPNVTVTEEPSSPKGVVKSPALETSKKELKPSDHNNGSAERSEVKTPDSLEEYHPEENVKVEKSENKSSPQGGRRYGVQVMGSGLMAEMKAKQEKRAAVAQKKSGNEAAPKESHDSTGSVDRPDGSTTGAKSQPVPPEGRFPLNRSDSSSASPEKNAKPEPKIDPGARPRSSSSTPTSPKTPLQSTKLSFTGRPSVPQKPRSNSRNEEVSDSPTSHSSPKVPLLPPVLKRAPSDKERDGQNSPQFSGSGSWSSQEVDHTGDHSKSDAHHDYDKPAIGKKSASRQFSTSAAEEMAELERRKSLPRTVRPASVSEGVSKCSPGHLPHEDQEQKPRSPNKDGQHGSKLSDSGEEADKDFIFV
ncbi:F-actin-uncapping protein LRRC16A isoform X3 [Latimeria chalumnae]|uniref:F-actin-uncapping protein LRRC16A isoform X3 n=1 Tax=Latimeria chalumnae TaxID=7897 RepID=UPI0006D8F8EB|nr:PREDICTED: leucine-rich repeat-containing protein 16A isoform X3 [Latimeria chalumnae]|eukprot:XP_006009840.2 PREDICTED: leucine-rich repeat-containing protein 16A isoform X3 [Latimeria chalumnae]